jgi:hypothetical protein
MKKYGLLIVIGILIALNLNAGPVSPSVVVDPNTVAVKIDDNTVEITTTTTTVRVVERDKAELQTEKDHIPEHVAELQEQIAALNDRSTEIDKILEVFK